MDDQRTPTRGGTGILSYASNGTKTDQQIPCSSTLACSPGKGRNCRARCSLNSRSDCADKRYCSLHLSHEQQHQDGEQSFHVRNCLSAPHYPMGCRQS